eukprot:2359393-Amphidinium_carterae.1
MMCGTGPPSVWLPADTWAGDYSTRGLHGSVVFPLTSICFGFQEQSGSISCSALAAAPLCQQNPWTSFVHGSDFLTKRGFPWKGNADAHAHSTNLCLENGPVSPRRWSDLATISLAGRLMRKGASLRTHASATSAVKRRAVWTASVTRPLSDEVATAPKRREGEVGLVLVNFLTSKILSPACGLEEATDLKPDHVASTTKAAAKKRRYGWNKYVRDMRKEPPNKIYKWISGTTAVWGLAVHDEDGFA